MDTLLGFVVVVEREDGFAGGYLCTNMVGVPIEFKYTSGVKPSHRQELLYGRTLKPELLGKHITGTLLRGIDPRPQVILTDEEAVLLGFQESGLEVLQVIQGDGANEAESLTTRRVETATGAVTLKCRGDVQALDELLGKLSDVDLLEPLDRAKKVLEDLRQGAS